MQIQIIYQILRKHDNKNLNDYQERYIKSLQINFIYNPKNICNGSKVLLKLDFNNNSLTKRRPLNNLYKSGYYVVVKIIERSVKIAKNNITKSIDISRLKNK